jgi:hypothetical protein
VCCSAPTVTSAKQTRTIAPQTTGWSNNVGFQKFNPALGALVDVNLTLTSDVRAQQGFENLGSTASQVSATQTASLALKSLTGQNLLGVVTTLSNVESLLGYDGTADFAGASGIKRDLVGGTFDQVSLGDQADLDLFTGKGAIDLTAGANGTSTVDGPGNLLLDLAEQAGLTIDLTYTYVPDANASAILAAVPEPGSLPLFAGALACAGSAAARRRRK